MGIDFEASGDCVFETFTPDGAKAAQFTSRFTVQRSAEKWVILHRPDDSTTTVHVMFDGQDVYCLTRGMPVDPRLARQFPKPEARFTMSNGVAYASTASISAGAYPLAASDAPRVLWYALLSGPFLSGTSTPDVPAPWGSAYSPESRAFKLSVTWPETGSPFPESIRFLASKDFWTEAMRQMLRRPNEDMPPFADGAVAGVYEVKGWTNLNGHGDVRFPMDFEVVRYHPPLPNKAAVVAERFSCRVAAAGLFRHPIAPIPLNESYVDVLDGRFQDAQHPQLTVMYRITNQTWKPTSDAELSQLVHPHRKEYEEVRSKAAQLGKASRPHRSPMQRAFVVFLCTLVVFSMPVALGVRWVRSRRRNKESS